MQLWFGSSSLGISSLQDTADQIKGLLVYRTEDMVCIFTKHNISEQQKKGPFNVYHYNNNWLYCCCVLTRHLQTLRMLLNGRKVHNQCTEALQCSVHFLPNGKSLTHIPPHSWQAVWGCAHSPLGVTAAGPAAAWQYSQNQRRHSWSEASTACSHDAVHRPEVSWPHYH